MSFASVALGALGLDGGGALLLQRALRGLAPGATLAVYGAHPALGLQLAAWARAAGHAMLAPSRDAPATHLGLPLVGRVVKGPYEDARWHGAERAGGPGPHELAAEASPRWGLALRGAEVEATVAPLHFALRRRDELWCDEAPRLYQQALAAQWNPETALPWERAVRLDDDVEDAVLQVMTYLAENETAALLVNARFLARVHPHFREVLQLLAVQAADEARHLEVFNRRALLFRPAPARSSAGGQASLATLLEEPDFALASFLTSVLGEGTFLELLWFLHEHAPEPLTGEILRLAAQDEARHVAFGLAHLARHAGLDAGLHGRLRATLERRHAALAQTAGLNDAVFDALVLLAAGSFEPDALAQGYRRVQALQRAMLEQRELRLRRLGFGPADAAELAALHTRNFM